MQVNGILGHAGAIVIIVVGLLSGVLSVIREFQVMYIPARAGDKRTFWAWVRIAFVVAAVLLWWDEHTKVIQLSKPKEIVEVNVAQRPWLVVSGAKISSKDSLNLAGIMIHVKNTGSVPATARFVLMGGKDEPFDREYAITPDDVQKQSKNKNIVAPGEEVTLEDV